MPVNAPEMIPFSSSSVKDGRFRSWRATVSALSCRSSWCFGPCKMGATVAVGSSMMCCVTRSSRSGRDSSKWDTWFWTKFRSSILAAAVSPGAICASASACKANARLINSLAGDLEKRLLSRTPFDTSSPTGGRFESCWLTLSALSWRCNFSCVACRLGATVSASNSK